MTICGFYGWFSGTPIAPFLSIATVGALVLKYHWDNHLDNADDINTATNLTAGISIGTYEGTSANGKTIGHGLGAIPDLFMIKGYSGSGTKYWVIGAPNHPNFLNNASKHVFLDTTMAVANNTTMWGNIAFTSTTAPLNSHQAINHVKVFFSIPVRIETLDRKFLESKIFPYLNEIYTYDNKLLFIGVAQYTKHYYPLLKYDVRTIDNIPGQSKYGNNKKHTMGSALNLSKHYEESFFDVIVANGLIGYGTNNKNDFNNLLHSCFRCLKNEGILIVGYNNTPNHLNFKIKETVSYKVFEEFIPSIKTVTNLPYIANPKNNHTFIFLKKIY